MCKYVFVNYLCWVDFYCNDMNIFVCLSNVLNCNTILASSFLFFFNSFICYPFLGLVWEFNILSDGYPMEPRGRSFICPNYHRRRPEQPYNVLCRFSASDFQNITLAMSHCCPIDHGPKGRLDRGTIASDMNMST